MEIEGKTVETGQRCYVKIPANNKQRFTLESGEVTDINEEVKCVKVCHNRGTSKPANEWFKASDVTFIAPPT